MILEGLGWLGRVILEGMGYAPSPSPTVINLVSSFPLQADLRSHVPVEVIAGSELPILIQYNSHVAYVEEG